MKRLLPFVLLIVAVSCDSNRRRGGGTVRVVCNTGDTRPCTCPDQTQSMMLCSGGTFGACQCSTVADDAGTRSDSGVPPGDGGVRQDSGIPMADTGVMDTGVRDTGTNICETDPECSPPTTICQNLACVPGCLQTGCSGTDTCDTNTGRCVSGPGGPCDVWNDQCPTGTVCTINGTTSTCQASGGATAGNACNPTTNNCAPGQGTCFDFGFGPRCYQGCEANNPTCTQPQICWLITQQWGICDDLIGCNLLAQQCPAGRACSAIGDGTMPACLAAGNVQRGGSCSIPDNNCQTNAGNVCVDVGNGSLCYEVCDPNGVDNCTTGTCTALTGLSWAVCF